MNNKQAKKNILYLVWFYALMIGVCILCSPIQLYATVLKQQQINAQTTHRVLAGETAYSIAKRYNIPLQVLYEANPSAQDGLKEGTLLFIPSSIITRYMLHVVRKGETFYSLSKQYGVSIDAIKELNELSQEDTLQEGASIKIPVQEGQISGSGQKTAPPSSPAQSIVRDYAVKVGLLFPFIEADGGQSSRLVEYLQGFLLAVEDFKQKQGNADVYVFNIEPEQNTQRLKAILETNEFKNLDLLVGGVSAEQIATLAQFAYNTKTPYVLPLSSRYDAIYSNPYVFQINTPHVNIYHNIINTFIQKFEKTNIIILKDTDIDHRGDKTEFVNALKETLNIRSIPYREINMDNLSADQLMSITAPYVANTIIPSSSAQSTLLKIVALIQEAYGDETPENIALFGYPEWQTYNSLRNSFRSLNTYFYSTFYVDNTQFHIEEISQRFQRAYGKPMTNSFPRFALLGYDAATFFLNAVEQYGKNPEKMALYRKTLLQSAFHFQKTGPQGGYMNMGLFFINNQYGQIQKTELSR